MNEKLGLDSAFLDEKNPFDLFKIWMKEAEKKDSNNDEPKEDKEPPEN